MSSYQVSTNIANAHGGFGNETIVATHYTIHPCGALEFYNESRGPDALVQLLAPGTWIRVVPANG